jgi:2-keto-4-pentenoate hydratase/2-oxohepta-3-ene-1,7-dioic acid hydratase in catechol pathway
VGRFYSLKLVRFIADQKIHFGILEKEELKVVQEPGTDWCGFPLIETEAVYALETVKMLTPCIPSKVICLGLNYRRHAEEMKHELPKKPIIFIKPSTSVIGPHDAIAYPPQSKRVDYEAELGVVIGRRAYRVSRDKALDYVFGYTCANDVTARDKQPAHGQWTYAKGFDTFCPLGPVIETAITDPEKLKLKGYLNGKLVQETSTSDHVFAVDEIIEFVSGCMTLLPGDVILTGTPAGVGPLIPGDKFTVEIEGIGILTNSVTRI